MYWYARFCVCVNTYIYIYIVSFVLCVYFSFVLLCLIVYDQIDY